MEESSETESDTSSANMDNTETDSRLQSDSEDNGKAFGDEICLIKMNLLLVQLIVMTQKGGQTITRETKMV